MTDHNGTDTSRFAAAYNQPRRPRDRERVLAALTAAGEYGLTDFELADVLTRTGPRIQQTSAGKRRLDLLRDGLICRRFVVVATKDGPAVVADKRPSPTRASAAVWHLSVYSESL